MSASPASRNRPWPTATAGRVPLLLAAGLAATLAAVGCAAASSLQPRVRVETTAGAFVIEVDAVRAPLTAENFLRYVRDGFYDGLIMHRVIPNFVVQGGGYTADYGPRTTAAAIVNESGNGLSNARGTVGMARGETPHSATSQFYVNVNDNPGLNPLPTRWGYTVFGQVVEGMEVVDGMAYAPTGVRSGFADTPLEPIVIRRAFVVGEQDGETTPPAVPAAPAADGGQAGEPAGDQQETDSEPPAASPPDAGTSDSRA